MNFFCKLNYFFFFKKKYNRAPIAYIQRIVVKSIFNIPKSKIHMLNRTDDINEKRLFFIDLFRTPLSRLFELNDFIRNFRSKDKKSLISDMCVHIGELSKKEKLSTNNRHSTDFNRHFLPEFNCLYLSPANFWSNNFAEFANDNDFMNTINNFHDYIKNSNLDQNQHLFQSENEENTWSEFFSNLINHLINDDFIIDEQRETNIRELLFGVSWSSTLKSLDENDQLLGKIDKKIPQNDTKSIVMTYAITLALKKCDLEFLKEFGQKLNEKFNIFEDERNYLKNNQIYNLQYTRQSIVYYIPFVMLYLLLFLYIYISIRKIEFIKSKWGLAFAAVAQVIVSLFMSIGICSYFGLTPTLNGGEIFPYLIIMIGFENIVVLTKSVVSTPFDLDVRYRIALGLKKESWLITKILTFELIIIFFGILTMVPAIQEFCIFAYVGLLTDFFMQNFYFVTVLSIDIRRMELSDLNKKIEHPNSVNRHSGSSIVYNEDKTQTTYRGYSKQSDTDLLSDKNNCHHKIQSNWFYYLNYLFGKNSANYFTNKSVQFFYFWANTRLVQRVIIFLAVLWILLIFYKSLLVVELMRYDVNVKKETVEALLPKGVGFSKLFKDNFQQLLFTTTNKPQLNQNKLIDSGLTFDNLKQSFNNLMVDKNNSYKGYGSSTVSSYNSFESKKAYLLGEQNWQSLSYYHWLTLFSYYNISLYDRYVTILPQINLYSLINKSDILKFRNMNEINKYNSFITVDNESKFLLENDNYSTIGKVNHLFAERINAESDRQVKSAVFELMAIVVFGIPAIFTIVYLLAILYKFLCSKNYEEWRKTWSTSNIRQKYKLIHRKRTKSMNENDFFDKKCSNCYSKSESECSDSEFSDEIGSKSSNHLLNLGKKTNQDDYINKIINGQKDEIDLVPFKTIDCDSELRHDYSLDLLSIGSCLFVTSDVSNQLKIWSLDDSIYNTINMDNCASIWSICLTDDDQFVLVGFSDGSAKFINLTTNHTIDYQSNNSNGITDIKELKSKINKSDTFLRQNFSFLNEENYSYSFLICRLNGVLELIEIENKNFNLMYKMKAHGSPITNFCYANGGDYLLTSSQDLILKIIKINCSNFNQNDKIIKQKELRIMFESIDHADSPITSICIDKDNTINAATGSQDGTIFIWNLFTCEKIRVLNDIMNGKLKSPGIIKLELSQNLLISINYEHQMCIFNRVKGKLIKEFKFFAPIIPSQNRLNEDSDLNSFTDDSLNFVSSSIFSFLISGLFNFLYKNIFYNRSNGKKIDEVKSEEMSFQPIPSMCLYSRSILITGGCSSIFLWNIEKGELIKKISIKKYDKIGKNYSQLNTIKDIKLIGLSDFNSKSSLNAKLKRANKLVLVTDYNDAIYVLKIPISIVQNYD